MNPIQMLDFIVDPTVDAILTDDGLGGQTPPGEGGWEDSSGVVNPRYPTRKVRRKGSGMKPRGRGTVKLLATAVDDELEVDFGDGPTDVDVLANDTYSGTPRIIIIDPPANGTARVVGRGSASRIRYRPPAHGDDTLVDVVTYQVRATGNARSSGHASNADVGELRVTVGSIDIAFVQSDTADSKTSLTTVTAGVGVLGTPFDLVFPVTPDDGNLLTVFVTTLSVGDDDLSFDVATTLTVKNAAGQSYTQVGTYQAVDSPAGSVGVEWRLSMWRRVASAGVDEKTVTVTPTLTSTGDAFPSVCQSLAACHEYSGTGSSPFDAYSENSDTGAGPPEAWSTGQINVAGTGEVLVAAFRSNSGESNFFTFDAAIQRTSQDLDFDTTGNTYGLTLFTGDVLDVSLSVPVTGTDAGGASYLGVGASFKK